MIQNTKYVLGLKSKKTGKFLHIGEAFRKNYVPEDKVTHHKDGSVSVRFQFPELEVDE